MGNDDSSIVAARTRLRTRGPHAGEALREPQQRKSYRELDLEMQQSYRVRPVPPMGAAATSSGKAAEPPQQRRSYRELEMERQRREAERTGARGRVVHRDGGLHGGRARGRGRRGEDPHRHADDRRRLRDGDLSCASGIHRDGDWGSSRPHPVGEAVALTPPRRAVRLPLPSTISINTSAVTPPTTEPRARGGASLTRPLPAPARRSTPAPAASPRRPPRPSRPRSGRTSRRRGRPAARAASCRA